MTANFQELLIVFSVLFFIIALYLIFRSRDYLERKNEKLPVSYSPASFKALSRIHYSLILLFVVVTGYSVWFGLRPFIYHVLFALLFVTSIYLALANPPEKKVFVTRTLLITAVMLSLTQSVLPTVENRLMIFGSDQWRDIFATKLIVEQGNSSTAAAYSGSYYSLIPAFSVLNTVVTLITGNVLLSFAIISATMGFTMVLMIYFILLKLTRSQLSSVVGIFVFLSTPRLALVQAIPSTVSLMFSSVLILFLLEYMSIPCRGTLAAFLMIAFSALVLHPIGIIILIVLCGGLVFIHIDGLTSQTYPQSKMMRYLLALVCIMSFAYWSLNDIVFTSIITPLQRLLSSVLTSLGPSVYTPRYFTGGSNIFSYVWALPVGISAAYVVTILYKLVQSRKNSHTVSKETLRMVPFVAGTIGLLLIAVAFMSIIHAPDASVERYVDNAAYLLLVMPVAVVSSQLIGSRQRLASVCVICLLAVSVCVGTGSPDWAPFENPTFTSIHTTYTSYVEANAIVKFLPNNVTIYSDYDIAVDGVAAMAGISFSAPGSFQTTRNVLDLIKNGAFNPFVLTYANANVDAAYVIKLDEVQNTTVLDKYMDILYNSGLHAMLRTP